MPPSTPVYGFPFEDADDQPGISLNGGSGGLSPILAEALEAELIRIEGDVGSNTDAVTSLDARVAALEAVNPQRIATTIRTTNSANFSSTEVSINTVTATLVAGRTYRVRWIADISTVSGAGSIGDDVARMRLRENNVSGTVMQLRDVLLVSTRNIGFTLEAEFTALSSGSKTFAATAIRFAGVATMACNANANEPHFLYVDYIRG